MISSMTGFARVDTEVDAGTLSWEIRSVNHRYLETSFRLPEGFRPIEPELRALVGEKLKRGKLDASLYLKTGDTQETQLELNEALVSEIVRHGNRVGELIGNDGNINPLSLLRWPGVLEPKAVDTESLLQPAANLLAQALDNLAQSRISEGEKINAMLEDRLQQILDIVDTVTARLPEVLENTRTRMKERADAIEQKIDADRLEQELLILAQKQDVAEELDRLKAHVAEIRSILQSEEAVGRRLDFMMQELNREANTLGSKSADALTSKCAVDLKVLIEQMREQVQNVE